jgi:hypothetical protein
MLAASTMTLPLIDGDGKIDNPSQILAPSFDFED